MVEEETSQVLYYKSAVVMSSVGVRISVRVSNSKKNRSSLFFKALKFLVQSDSRKTSFIVLTG